MMKRHARLILLCATMFLAGCGESFEPLQRSDLERWVRAYENIAVVSPALLEQKRASGADSVLTCSTCRSTLGDQVVKAGYPNLQSFVITDTRIKVAQIDFLHRKMTSILGSLDDAARAEAKKSCVASDSSDPDKQIVAHGLSLICWMLVRHVEQMKKTSAMEDAIISKISIESDVVFVGENYATMDRTMSDERLIEDYGHSLSPQERNSPDRQRIRACNRLELGFGDAQDKATCPSPRPEA